jgi:hypothetical protein
MVIYPLGRWAMEAVALDEMNLMAMRYLWRRIQVRRVTEKLKTRMPAIALRRIAVKKGCRRGVLLSE